MLQVRIHSRLCSGRRVSHAFEMWPLSDLKQRKVSEAACPAAGTRGQEDNEGQVLEVIVDSYVASIGS